MHIDANQYYRILPVKTAIEQKLIALPGVTGVDVGLKEVGGQPTSIHGIIVFVRRKGVFRPEHRIPPMIEGVPTDVVQGNFDHRATVTATATYPAPTAPAIDTKRYDPCQGGACIAPARFNDRYGSLGMIVRDGSTNEQLWLSVYHVLCIDAQWNDPGVDKRIVQPAIAVGGNPATDTIGSVVNGKYGQIVVNWGYDLYVDCAVCTVAGRAVSTNIPTIGTPKGAANAEIADLVRKYGATTGQTIGTVISTNFTVNTNGTWFYYQYRVGPAFPTDPPFSEPGDSGAAVIDSQFRVIGLVKSGSTEAKTSTINPIGQIIDALNIVVPS